MYIMSSRIVVLGIIMIVKGEYILNSYRDRHGSEKVPAYLKIMLVQLMDLHLLKIIKH